MGLNVVALLFMLLGLCVCESSVMRPSPDGLNTIHTVADIITVFQAAGTAILFGAARPLVEPTGGELGAAPAATQCGPGHLPRSP